MIVHQRAPSQKSCPCSADGVFSRIEMNFEARAASTAASAKDQAPRFRPEQHRQGGCPTPDRNRHPAHVSLAPSHADFRRELAHFFGARGRPRNDPRPSVVFQLFLCWAGRGEKGPFDAGEKYKGNESPVHEQGMVSPRLSPGAPSFMEIHWERGVGRHLEVLDVAHLQHG